VNNLTSTDILLIIGAVVLVLIQASWIFYDASKRGENKWLWGIFGLLNVPSCLFIYLIITRLIMKKKSCPSCGKYISMDSKYCSHCGTNLER
jgi:NADH:ubiquinone oxidoreductase subunit 6 (subunit J)